MNERDKILLAIINGAFGDCVKKSIPLGEMEKPISKYANKRLRKYAWYKRIAIKWHNDPKHVKPYRFDIGVTTTEEPLTLQYEVKMVDQATLEIIKSAEISKTLH